VSSALVVEGLRRDRAAMVRNLASATLVDTVTAELRVKLDESGTDHQAGYPSGSSGRNALRCHGVLRFSPSSAELIAHRMVLEVADAILLPACADYQLGSTTAIEILPGQGQGKPPHSAQLAQTGFSTLRTGDHEQRFGDLLTGVDLAR
jgi:hypothetical protein